MLPMYNIISNLIGHSLVGQNIPHEMDMDFVMELLSLPNSGMGSLGGLMLVVPVLYWLVGLFLSGGAFFTLRAKEVYSTSIFWAASATYFWRFIKLFLWSIPLFGILYSLQFIESGIQFLFFGSDPYQNIIFWGALIKVGLSYIGILIYYLIFDYARIYIITSDERKTHRALWQGIKFTFKNLLNTFSITFILFLLGGAVLVIYNFISDAIRTESTIILLILLIIQQCYIALRMIIRLTLYASQANLYSQLTAIHERIEPLRGE
jgi:hypothetical protein